MQDPDYLEIKIWAKANDRLVLEHEGWLDVFLCGHCDDTHVQIMTRGPKGERIAIMLVLDARQAEILAKRLNAPPVFADDAFE